MSTADGIDDFDLPRAIVSRIVKAAVTRSNQAARDRPGAKGRAAGAGQGVHRVHQLPDQHVPLLTKGKRPAAQLGAQEHQRRGHF